MLCYQSYGLNIQSEFLLPELTKSNQKPDIYIQKGKVKLPKLEPTSINRQGKEAYFGGDTQSAYLRWEGIASLLAKNGDTLIVDPDSEDIDPQILSMYILSEALGLILYQRGLFLLHASAVLIDGQVVIFAGCPGAGKSTTAAAFAKLGYTVLSDDMVAIDLRKSPLNPPNVGDFDPSSSEPWEAKETKMESNSSSPQNGKTTETKHDEVARQQYFDRSTFPTDSECPLNPPSLWDFDPSSSEPWEAKKTKLDSNSSSPQNWEAKGADSQNWEAREAKINQPMVYPAFPQIKIWQPSVEGLGYDISTLPTLYPGSRKRVIRKPENFPATPFPLSHIFFLEDGADFKVTPMEGNDAFLTLARFFPIPSQLLAGETLSQHFQQSLQLINQVDLWKIKKPKDFKILKDLIAGVEQKVAETNKDNQLVTPPIYSP